MLSNLNKNKKSKPKHKFPIKKLPKLSKNLKMMLLNLMNTKKLKNKNKQ